MKLELNKDIIGQYSLFVTDKEGNSSLIDIPEEVANKLLDKLKIEVCEIPF